MMPSLINQFSHKYRLNLKQRLAIFTILTTLSSVFISGYSAVTLSRSIIEKKTEGLVKNQIVQVSHNIDEVIVKQVINISNMLRYDAGIQEILKKKYPKSPEGEKEKLIDELMLSGDLLQKYLSVYEDIKIAVIMGKNDVLYNIYYPPTENVEGLTDRIRDITESTKMLNSTVQWHSLENNPYTDTALKNIRKQKTITASRSIFTVTTQEYIGTVLFVIEEQSIYNKYSKMQLGEKGEVFLLENNGKLISSSNQDRLLQGIQNSSLLDNILQKGNSVFMFKEDNEDLLVLTFTSGINGWITAGIVPLGDVYGEPEKIYRIIFLISFVTILFAIFVITIIVDRVVHPIRCVVKSMEEVEKGNLDVSVDIRGEYEVSNLGKYFNSMIKRIKQLIQEEYELGKKKKQSELDALMYQINPHFLYNALDSIVWMAQSIGAADIVKMTSSLGRLLRIGINRGRAIVPVREELDHVKAYLEVQEIRYRDKFEYIFNVMDEEFLEYMTLKLILQPIVENSLQYNIGTTDGKLAIEVNVAVEDQMLVLRIRDNGIGIESEKLDKMHQNMYSTNSQETEPDNEVLQYKGIGLRNIHERIRLYFGEGYGLTVTSEYGNGTTVIIKLPVMHKKEQEK